jgi:hypothetical protein
MPDIHPCDELIHRAHLKLGTNEKRPPMGGKTGGPESTATRLFGGNLLPAHCDLTDSVSPFSGQNLAFCLLTGTKSGFW